jgi:hypothetical protein
MNIARICYPKIEGIDQIFASLPELKLYYYTISENKVNVTIELVQKSERKEIVLL